MRRRIRNAKGFTLVELLIALVVVGILAGALLLVSAAGADKAQASRVVSDLRNLKAAAVQYNASSGAWPASVTDLSDYLDGPLECAGPVCYEVASGEESGNFVGFRADLSKVSTGVKDRLKGMAETVSLYSDTELTRTYAGEAQAVYPVGYAGSGATASVRSPMTPLGDNFFEITAELIRRIQDYHSKSGKWPSDWKDSRFTDLGLDPSKWGKNRPWPDHIGYELKGKTVQVKPEKGFALIVVRRDTGTEYIFCSSLNWDLIYDIPSNQWYYNKVEPGKEIDVSNLRVIPDPEPKGTKP